MERCLEVGDILVVDVLLFCEKSVVVDVILHAALVSPEQLIVSWVFRCEVSGLSTGLLNAVNAMSDFVMGHQNLLMEPGIEVSMIMLVRRLIEASKLGDTPD